MKFDDINEAYSRYNINYEGTREDYQIHDDDPYIIALDKHYNVDGKGDSILAINLHYYEGDVKKMINDINKFDDESGFFAYELKLKAKKLLGMNTKDEADMRIKRYQSLVARFPILKKFIRRYKYTGPNGTGIQTIKKKFLKN
jgi:hypothetical protein